MEGVGGSPLLEECNRLEAWEAIMLEKEFVLGGCGLGTLKCLSSGFLKTPLPRPQSALHSSRSISVTQTRPGKGSPTLRLLLLPGPKEMGPRCRDLDRSCYHDLVCKEKSQPEGHLPQTRGCRKSWARERWGPSVGGGDLEPREQGWGY